MSTPADRALNRLRTDPQHVESLVGLVVEDMLSRPVSELVEPAWISERLVDGLRASATDARTEAWIRARLDDARAQLAEQVSRPRESLPAELIDATRDLIRRPYIPDRDLMRRLMDHYAVGNLLREVLHKALLDFATRFKAPTPKLSPTNRLSKLVGVAQEVAGVVGHGVEKQLEGRVRAFVDGAIAGSVARMVDHLCSPERAGELADWRSDGLDVILDVPVDRWLIELEKLDPDGLVTDLAALIRAVANTEGLTGQVEAVLSAAVAEAGDRSARDFLEGSGLEEGWRPHMEALATERAVAVVRTDAFEGWIRGVLE